MASVENSNNLGAPAQGFGQDVTFAFKPGEVPTQQDFASAEARPAQTGVLGGDANRQAIDHTVTARAPEDHTFEMLMRAGSDILEPMLKEKRTEAFVRGMSAVAQGEAVTDIVAKQPWYAAIFGGSDAVAGARAFAGHQQASLASAAMEDQMPQLRSVSPDQAQKAFVGIINANLTGDPQTDNQVMGSLLNQMPALMRRQAKEHYAWQQDQASQGEAKAMTAGAQLLQKQAEGTVFEAEDGQVLPGVTRPEEFAAAKKQFVQSIAPVAGRDAVNWQLNTSKTLTSLARQGYFHALRAFDEAGGFGALTEQQATSVRQAWESEEKDRRVQGMTDYTKQLADIRAGVKYPTDGQTLNDYAKRVDDINNAYMAKTGSRVGIVTPEQKVELLTTGLDTIRKAQLDSLKDTQKDAKAAATQAAKDDAQRRGIMQGAAMLEAGNFPEELNENDTRRAWEQLQSQPDKYFKAVDATFRTSGKVDVATKQLAVNTVGGAISANDPNALATIYETLWTPLNRNGASADVADAYMGDNAKGMRLYDRARRAGIPATQAFNQAFVLPSKRASVNVGEKADKQLVDDVGSTLSYKTPEWWGTTEVHGNIDLRPDQQALVAGLVKREVHSEMLDDSDHKRATVTALRRLQASEGLQVLGGYAWLNGQGKRPLEVDMDSRVPRDKIADTLRSTVDAKVKAIGATGNRITLTRDTNDKAGNPRFVGTVLDDDGAIGVFTFTGNDLASTYATGQATRKGAEDAVDAARLQFGNGLY